MALRLVILLRRTVRHHLPNTAPPHSHLFSHPQPQSFPPLAAPLSPPIFSRPFFTTRPLPLDHARPLQQQQQEQGKQDAPSSSSSAEGGSWWSRMKGMIWKDKDAAKEAGAAGQPSPPTRDVAVALEAFAGQLDQAQRMGSLATFGRGLPQGKEGLVTASLQQQRDIARALAALLPPSPADPATQLREDGSPSPIPPRLKAEVAARVGCQVAEVETFVDKFSWFCRASARVEELKAQGKPLPKSFAEVEEMMGGRWSRGGSGGAGASAPSRNQPCPCGSGKKFKRCCGARS